MRCIASFLPASVFLIGMHAPGACPGISQDSALSVEGQCTNPLQQTPCRCLTVSIKLMLSSRTQSVSCRSRCGLHCTHCPSTGQAYATGFFHPASVMSSLNLHAFISDAFCTAIWYESGLDPSCRLDCNQRLQEGCERLGYHAHVAMSAATIINIMHGCAFELLSSQAERRLCCCRNSTQMTNQQLMVSLCSADQL